LIKVEKFIYVKNTEREMWENQLNNEEMPSSSLTTAELQLRASKGLLVVRTRVSSVMRIYMYVIPE